VCQSEGDADPQVGTLAGAVEIAAEIHDKGFEGKVDSTAVEDALVERWGPSHR